MKRTQEALPAGLGPAPVNREVPAPVPDPPVLVRPGVLHLDRRRGRCSLDHPSRASNR